MDFKEIINETLSKKGLNEKLDKLREEYEDREVYRGHLDILYGRDFSKVEVKPKVYFQKGQRKEVNVWCSHYVTSKGRLNIEITELDDNKYSLKVLGTEQK